MIFGYASSFTLYPSHSLQRSAQGGSVVVSDKRSFEACELAQGQCLVKRQEVHELIF